MAWFDGTSITNMEIIKEGYSIEVKKMCGQTKGKRVLQ